MRCGLRVFVSVVAVCTQMVGPALGPARAQSGSASDRPTDIVPAADGEPSYALQGDTLRVLMGADAVDALSLPCAGVQLGSTPTRFFVGCGRDLVVVSLDEPLVPVVLGRLSYPDTVVATEAVEDAIWAVLADGQRASVALAAGVEHVETTEPRQTHTDAGVEGSVVATKEGDALLAAGSSSAAAAKPSSAPEPPKVVDPVGQVVETHEDHVVVDLGKVHGVVVGDRIAMTATPEPSEQGSDADSAGEPLRLVGVVTGVSENRAEVVLDLDVPASLMGADARLTIAQPTTAVERLALARTGGSPAGWELGFHARSYVGIGFGIGADVWAARRFEAPILLRLQLDPTAGWAESAKMVGFAGDIVIAYESRSPAHDPDSWELGAGLGWLRVNTVPGPWVLAGDCYADRGCDQSMGGGLSFVQTLRFGARDGTAIRLHNTLVIAESVLFYGGTKGVLQVPIGARSWLLARAGGSLAGSWAVEGGFRYLLQGAGLSESLYLTVTGGVAGLFFTGPSDDGPSVGFGLEYRP